MIGLLASVVLALSLALLCARRLDTTLMICAGQAICSAAVLARQSIPVAMVAGVLNGIALPMVVWRMPTANRIIAARAPWAAALLVLLSGAALAGMEPPGLVAAGLAVTLLGVVLAVGREHPLMAVPGLLSSQSGIILLAAAEPTLSLPMAFAVAVPLLPALVAADGWLRP